MPIRYLAPPTLDAAATLLAAPAARPLGGGTDLLVAMEAGLDPAATLVDITRTRGLTSIEESSGGVRIGAAVRLEEVAASDLIRGRFPALALAAAAVGTPALRAMGTVGGNLGQRPRCWYLRSRIPCLKNGSTGCPARDGENQYHAIFDSGPCRAPHPSDIAVALHALDAAISVRRGTTVRRIDVAALYANAASDPHRECSIGDGEIIEAVELPAESAGGTQRFTKLMQRGAWDFATVSLAGVKRADGTVRLVLGGVAAAPYRVNSSVEEDVASGALDEESTAALAERALYDAEPLAMNGYKVAQAAALLRRAMFELSRV